MFYVNSTIPEQEKQHATNIEVFQVTSLHGIRLSSLHNLWQCVP